MLLIHPVRSHISYSEQTQKRSRFLSCEPAIYGDFPSFTYLCYTIYLVISTFFFKECRTIVSCDKTFSWYYNNFFFNNYITHMLTNKCASIIFFAEDDAIVKKISADIFKILKVFLKHDFCWLWWEFCSKVIRICLVKFRSKSP